MGRERSEQDVVFRKVNLQIFPTWSGLGTSQSERMSGWGWSRVLEAPALDHVYTLHLPDLGKVEKFPEPWGGRHSEVTAYQLVRKYVNILTTSMALRNCHGALSLTKGAHIQYILCHFLEVACWRNYLSATTLHGFSNKGSNLYKRRWGHSPLGPPHIT